MAVNMDRRVYRERFRLTKSQAKLLDRDDINQLEQCADDAARRLLLGTSSTCRPKGLKARRQG